MANSSTELKPKRKLRTIRLVLSIGLLIAIAVLLWSGAGGNGCRYTWSGGNSVTRGVGTVLWIAVGGSIALWVIHARVKRTLFRRVGKAVVLVSVVYFMWHFGQFVFYGRCALLDPQ